MTPITLAVLVLGLFVLVMTLVGAFMIGLREAADTDQAQPGDVTDLERKLIDRDDGGRGGD